MKKNTKQTASNRTLVPEKWMESHFDYLLNFATGRMPDLESARDIVQQTFMAAWKGRKSFRGDSAERTWLTTILRNKITDFYRARSRRPQLVEMSSLDDDENETQSWLESRVAERECEEPDEVIGRSEYLAEVLSAVADLPSTASKVLQMRVFEGSSVKEIANKLNLSPGSVSTKICRARKRLRAEFGLLAQSA